MTSQPMEFAPCQQQLYETLTCCICLNIPNDPIILECNHIFCRICITVWTQTKRICPLDMRDINSAPFVSLKVREPFFFKTMYSVLQVLCPNKCEWVGYVGSYNAHVNKHCKKTNIPCMFECEKKDLERGRIQQHFDEVHCKQFLACDTLTFRQLLALQNIDYCPIRLVKLVISSISFNVMQFMEDSFRLKPLIDKFDIESRVFAKLRSNLFMRKCSPHNDCTMLEQHFFQNVICALFEKQREEQWQKMMNDGIYCAEEKQEIANTVVFDKKIWGCTPSILASKIAVPQCFQSAIESNKSEYKQLYPKKRLLFDFSQGKAEVNLIFKKGEQAMIVSSLQMIILEMFNREKKLSAQDISTALFAQKMYVPRVWLAASDHLMSLCHPKVHVLHKTPHFKQLALTDVFQFNENFTPSSSVLNVPLLTYKNTTAVLRGTLARIAEERTICILRNEQQLSRIVLFNRVSEDVKPRLQEGETFTMSNFEDIVQSLVAQNDIQIHPNGNVSQVI